MKYLLFLLSLPFLGMASFPKWGQGGGKPAGVEMVKGLAIDVSLVASDLIVHHEVGGETYYRKFLQKPTWPGHASGVTIGFGYDLGYNSPAQIRADWKGKIPAAMIDSMVSVSGIKGSRAAAEARRIRGSVLIPWETAKEVYEESTMPRFAKLALRAFPDIRTAHPHGQGAILSICFNRGTSMRGDTRREMRWMKYNLGHSQEKIPSDIRSMKRLWIGRGVDGLLRRREEEARLFEKGLQ